MFVDQGTARRIERAEAAATHETVAAIVAAGVLPRAVALDLKPGVATYVRADSPFNKVIGVGLAGPVHSLEEVESTFHARDEPVRIEISTLAETSAFEQLAARGYRLLGFENVLGIPLFADIPNPPEEIDVVSTPNVRAFRDTLIDGIVRSDDTGVVLDQFTHRTIEAAVDDSLIGPGQLYLAYVDGRAAGAGSMRIHDDVAIFSGAATSQAFRRRGVHAALIARRLADARAAGANVAAITTAPGTQSMANVMKHGFSLLYARAILSLPPR